MLKCVSAHVEFIEIRVLNAKGSILKKINVSFIIHTFLSKYFNPNTF